MENNFQLWLKSQGYYRNNGLEWMKNNEVVSGKELNDKLNEFKYSYSEKTTCPICGRDSVGDCC
jgi:hypothetical protein